MPLFIVLFLSVAETYKMTMLCTDRFDGYYKFSVGASTNFVDLHGTNSLLWFFIEIDCTLSSCLNIGLLYALSCQSIVELWQTLCILDFFKSLQYVQWIIYSGKCLQGIVCCVCKNDNTYFIISWWLRRQLLAACGSLTGRCVAMWKATTCWTCWLCLALDTWSPKTSQHHPLQWLRPLCWMNRTHLKSCRALTEPWLHACFQTLKGFYQQLSSLPRVPYSIWFAIHCT